MTKDISSNPKKDVTQDSSTENQDINLDVTQDSSPVIDEVQDSSPEKSMLDIVDEVLNESSEEKKEEVKAPELEEEKSGEETSDVKKHDDSDDDIPKEFHKHPRWNKLKEQRDEAKRQLEYFRDSSDRMGKIESFMSKNSITPEQTTTAFEFMSHVNNGRYKEALALIAPTVNELHKLTGESLPEDLIEKVNQGYIDEETAKEVALNRSALSAERVSNQRILAQTQAIQNQEFQKQLVQTAESIVNGLKTSDPDFSKKEGLMMDKVRLFVAERGIPKTPQQTSEYINEAYKSVNNLFAELRPEFKSYDKPSPKSAKIAAPPKPKSMLDAVERALNN